MLSGLTASGAADAPPASSHPSSTLGLQSRVAAPEKCNDARKAVRYYRAWARYWALKMGAGTSRAEGRSEAKAACPRIRYLAHRWQARAVAARKAYERWSYEWEWQRWLPDKFARVGACETGYGRRPGNWHWDSGTYVSAFGIYRPAYEAYHRWTGHNSPREQYEVAAAIQAKYGWGAWGCGGA